MKSKWFKTLAIIMSVCMLVAAFSACGKTKVSSDDTSSDLHGDAVDYDDDDANVSDGEETVTTSSGKTGSGKSSGTTSGKPVSNEGNKTQGNASETYHQDENKKKSFLESVPKSLSGKTVKILVWWNPRVAETAKMKEFTKKTGIKIKFITCGAGGEYTQKLSSMISQNQAPDLACIQQLNFPAVVMQDYFQPLSNGKLDLNDSIYDKDTMNKFKYKNQYYGAMIKGSTMITMNVLIYNADFFSQAGVKTPYQYWQEGNWNWDTFVTAGQEIQQKNSKIKAAITGEYQCNQLVQTANTDAVKFDNGKIINNCGDSALLNAWNFLHDLTDKYKILDSGINNRGFNTGEVAMSIAGNYVMQRGDWLDSDLVYNWGYAPLPSPKGQQLTVSSSVKLWGFPKGSKNTEAASYALRYWLDSTYDVKGSETWINDEIADFNAWLWEQPKCFSSYQGIVGYGGNYSWEQMSAELKSTDDVKSTLDSWSKVIDANIAKINKEFG